MFLGIIKLAIKWLRHKYVIAGVPVIMMNSKNQILLGKRTGKSLFYADLWGLPGGMIEYGESVEAAAKREVEEETGVKIEVVKRAKNFYEDFPNKNCKFHLINIPVYGKIIRGEPKAKEETSKIKWFDKSEIKKMNLAYNHNKILIGEGLI